MSIGVLQGELSGPVVVRMYTMDGSALSSRDYESINTTITFNSSISTRVIPVSVLEDQIDEDQENLLARLRLEPANGGLNVLIRPGQASLFIEDNDGTYVKKAS